MLDFLSRDELRAASAQQRAFWLANEVDPGTTAFNLLRVLQLKGVIDKDILEGAFDELIARHEVLRTGLVERNGMVLQRVNGRIQFVLDEQDFSALSEPERCMQVEAFAVRMSQTAFDLARTAALPSGAGTVSRRRAHARDRTPSRHHRWVVDEVL